MSSTLRLITWNVNGVRAAIKKGLHEKLEQLRPDIFCIQETKSDSAIMQSKAAFIPNYTLMYHSATNRKGYSGVATYLLESPEVHDDLFIFDDAEYSLDVLWTTSGLGIEQLDAEGRLVTTKFSIKDSHSSIKDFVIINGYYPQGGRGEHRISYKIEFYKQVIEYAKKLKNAGENVFLCGDFNTTVADIDLARPQENRKTTGCLPEERKVLQELFDIGFVDVFRHVYPDKPDSYTYWDQITRARERNVGWRIDYWIADSELIPFIKDITILSDVLGSDHCPVLLELVL